MVNLFHNFKNPRIIVAFFYDFCIAAFSFWFALALRFEFHPDKAFSRKFVTAFLVSQVMLVLSFFINGLYRGVWRFSSTHDLMRLVRASLMGIMSTVIVCFFINRMEGLPRSIFFIQFFVLVVGLGGGRFFYRILKDRNLMIKSLKDDDLDIKKVLIVGAGRAGEKLLRDINATPGLKLRVVGFIDDNRFNRNAAIHNVKVYGGSEMIPRVVSSLGVDKIFIAIPSAAGEEVKRIANFCKETQAELKILPKMDHLLSSQVEFSLLRNLKIEDLLGREQIRLDSEHLSNMIRDKVVLVTGAGGSIGSELCFQIAKFAPKFIIMADYCELFMYELEMRFKEAFPDLPFCPKILDVRNVKKVENVFDLYRPELVFHAAAYKHVPMMEHNPHEAIETNISGTKIVGEAAVKYKAEKFILISTDKAVNPTNVMGASKRVAEMVITNLAIKCTQTKFITVRFGNVLGSNGSVIPHFKKQIEERRDVTVTHPDIIRYFMSIPEACQLVLQAGSMGTGGEIFVLDMGEPVKIVDLAKEMIRLAGLVLDRDIKIIFTGLRPGEKLFEELFSDEESFEFTHHGKVRKARLKDIEPSFEAKLSNLINSESYDPDKVVYFLKDLVPELKHFRIKEVDLEDILPH